MLPGTTPRTHPVPTAQLAAGQRSGAQAPVAAASPRDARGGCLALQLTVTGACSVVGTGQQSALPALVDSMAHAETNL